jgi:hypothetical protein
LLFGRWRMMYKAEIGRFILRGRCVDVKVP